MPRPPSTDSVLRNLKKQTKTFVPSTAIATDMHIPNHSGDHSAGIVSETPTTDHKLANKKYVDDNDFWTRTGTTLTPETSGDDVLIDGVIAIGDASISQNIGVNVDISRTQAVEATIAANYVAKQTAATSVPVLGLKSAAVSAHTSGTIGELVGYSSVTAVNSDSDVTTVTALDGGLSHFDTKTPNISVNQNFKALTMIEDTASSNSIGFRVEPTTLSTGSLTNNVGFLCQAQSVGSNIWAALFEEDVQINTDKKFYLEGSLLTKGDTYFVFNSATTDVNLFVDNTKVVTWDNDLVEHHTDFQFTGSGSGLPYGEISKIGNSTATTITTQNVFVQYTLFDTNGENNLTTPDHTNDHITIDKTGRYLITCSITADSLSGAGATFEFEIQKNNGASMVGALHADRSLSGGGGETGSISISGIANLTATDTIELWVQNETNTQNIIIEDAVLSATQIGG